MSFDCTGLWCWKVSLKRALVLEACSDLSRNSLTLSRESFLIVVYDKQNLIPHQGFLRSCYVVTTLRRSSQWVNHSMESINIFSDWFSVGFDSCVKVNLNFTSLGSRTILIVYCLESFSDIVGRIQEYQCREKWCQSIFELESKQHCCCYNLISLTSQLCHWSILRKYHPKSLSVS